MRGAFNEKNLDSFVKQLILGKGSYSSFKGETIVKTIQPWDGLDKKPQSEPSETTNDEL
jgi:hypothetical protein